MINRWRQHFQLGILVLLVGLMAGCTAFTEVFTGKPSSSSPYDGPFEYALSVYQGGDYDRAEKLFNTLAKADTTDDQRMSAQLGEICSILMHAGSPEAMSRAVGLWETLKHSISDDTWRAERVLLDPLIRRFPAAAKKPAPVVPAAPSATSKKVKTADKKIETELTTLKKKAARATELQRQLDAVTAENQALKEKIKALEAIDQNIQKKKTEISAPSE